MLKINISKARGVYAFQLNFSGKLFKLYFISFSYLHFLEITRQLFPIRFIAPRWDLYLIERAMKSEKQVVQWGLSTVALPRKSVFWDFPREIGI
jgi:hypothetical protein